MKEEKQMNENNRRTNPQLHDTHANGNNHIDGTHIITEQTYERKQNK